MNDDDIDAILFSDEEETPRKRGRKKGSTNKSSTQKAFIEHTHKLYKDIEHMLTPEQREYFEMAFSGKAEFDPVYESELFLRFYSVYMTGLLSRQLNNDGVLKDMGQILGQYNTALKTLEDMRMKRKEMEMKQKNGNNEGVADLSRESALGRFENLHRKSSRKSTG